MSDCSIKTPCIGLCSTVYGDLVCRGCKRFHYEIIAWNTYSSTEKQAIWQRLEQFLVQIVSEKLHVTDSDVLRQQLIRRNILCDPMQSPYCWSYQLIAKGARFIQRLEAYGLIKLPAYNSYSLMELRDLIDREFQILSHAHYDRYIAPLFLINQNISVNPLKSAQTCEG